MSISMVPNDYLVLAVAQIHMGGLNHEVSADVLPR
jgi:hypothetical protein